MQNTSPSPTLMHLAPNGIPPSNVTTPCSWQQAFQGAESWLLCQSLAPISLAHRLISTLQIQIMSVFPFVLSPRISHHKANPNSSLSFPMSGGRKLYEVLGRQTYNPVIPQLWCKLRQPRVRHISQPIKFSPNQVLTRFTKKGYTSTPSLLLFPHEVPCGTVPATALKAPPSELVEVDRSNPGLYMDLPYSLYSKILFRKVSHTCIWTPERPWSCDHRDRVISGSSENFSQFQFGHWCWLWWHICLYSQLRHGDRELNWSLSYIGRFYFFLIETTCLPSWAWGWWGLKITQKDLGCSVTFRLALWLGRKLSRPVSWLYFVLSILISHAHFSTGQFLLYLLLFNLQN